MYDVVDDETGEGNEIASEIDESVSSTYKLMYKITQISSARKLMVIQLTYPVRDGKTTNLSFGLTEDFFGFQIAFATDSMVFLKLIEYGVSKESLGLLAVPLTPFEIVFPLILSRYSNGPTPLKFFVFSAQAR